jgi:hypothetical protein
MPRDDLHVRPVTACTGDRLMPTGEAVGLDACKRPVARASRAKPSPPYHPLAKGRSA